MKKTIFWLILLLLGITTFILQLFVFETPDGILGFIICLTSIYLMIGSIIKLYKINETAKILIKTIFETLFFWS